MNFCCSHTIGFSYCSIYSISVALCIEVKCMRNFSEQKMANFPPFVEDEFRFFEEKHDTYKPFMSLFLCHWKGSKYLQAIFTKTNMTSPTYPYKLHHHTPWARSLSYTFVVSLKKKNFGSSLRESSAIL